MDFAEIKRKSLKGGFIVIVAQGITVVVQLSSTVILARLLSPEEYGVLAMATSFTVFAFLFKDLGLSSAAIQKKGLTSEQQSNLFWLNFLFALLLALAVALFSPFVASFYGNDDLVGMILIISTNLMLVGISAQPSAMLTRRMQFGRQAITSVTSALATLAISYSLAFHGWGYWSLAWGIVGGSFVRTLLILAFSPFRLLRWSSGAGTRELLSFGANVTGFNVVNYFSRNLDNILIGKFLGAESLGLYSRAYQLLLFPIRMIVQPVNSVMYPALSALQDKPKEFRDYFLEVVRLLFFMTMTLSAGLILVAEDLVPMFLGSRWSGVVEPFRILGWVALVQPVIGVCGSVMLSTNESRRYLHFGILNASFVCLGFLVGIQFGLEGFCWAYLVAVHVSLIPLVIYSLKHSPVSALSYLLTAALPYIVAIVCLSFACWGSSFFELDSAYYRVLVRSMFYGGLILAAAFGLYEFGYFTALKRVKDTNKP